MEYKVNKIKLSPDVAIQKMRNWCAYQERSQHEAQVKLLEMGLNLDETNEIIATLITENYMNEERFTNAFCGGKFRIKLWGKNKIKAELRKHKVPEKMIIKAIQQIEPEEYILSLQKVINKRNAVIKKLSKQQSYYNILNYCISKGYESDLVHTELKETINNIN